MEAAGLAAVLLDLGWEAAGLLAVLLDLDWEAVFLVSPDDDVLDF